MAVVDLKGKRFTRLKVIEFAYSKKSNRYWKCKCDCGNEIYTTTACLNRPKNTRSCGCIQKEKAAENGRNSATTHGLSRNSDGTKTRLFRIWTGMKTRCFNENVVEYPRYGGKGVTICESWMDYKNFHAWAMSNGYKKHLSIEREDVNGDYEPLNCKWATNKEQTRNRTSSRFIEFNGETKTLAEWAEEKSMSINCLFERLKRGWSVKKSLETPKHK